MSKMKERRTGVVKGAIFPSHEDIKEVVARVRREIKGNRKFAEKFKSNPRRTLGALGLNEDVQTELLHEAGISAICWFTDCIHTCWCTKCCLTHLVFEKEK